MPSVKTDSAKPVSATGKATRHVNVLRWRYYDGSAGATARVYEVASDAERDCAFMREHSTDREWFIDVVPFIEPNQ